MTLVLLSGSVYSQIDYSFALRQAAIHLAGTPAGDHRGRPGHCESLRSAETLNTCPSGCARPCECGICCGSEVPPGYGVEMESSSLAQIGQFRHVLAQLEARIAAAALDAGRDREAVQLLPVTKRVSSQRLRVAAAAGCVRFGENIVQEMQGKATELADLDVAWSVIGHVQTNKAGVVARLASEFQGLDSLRLAAALDKRLQAEGRSLAVFVQVNTSGEDSKFGIPPAQTLDFLRQLQAFAALEVRGLMTLAVLSPDADRVRECFSILRTCRDRAREAQLVGPGELSMGMSGDFELAIAEGATVVRLGRALFGSRPA